MSTHLAAKQGEIAEIVLMPGDPLRAKWIAENFLENYFCYNEVRGMLGFTGLYKGTRVSIQGVGMGMPSISIYITELFAEYDVKRAIRLGTCGAMQPDIKILDLVLASAVSTNSGMNRLRFADKDYAPHANFKLLRTAYDLATELEQRVSVGGIFTSDRFYHDDPEHWRLWAEYGLLAVEMETAELYTLAAKYRVEALAILTVVDSLITKEEISAERREKSLGDMVRLGLETAIKA
jgi:purine-nucleoside phosphorylase